MKLGEIALLQGKRSVARERLREAKRTNHRSAGAHYLLGYLDWLARDQFGATDHLRKAVDLSSGASYSESASSEGITSKGARPLLEGGVGYTAGLPSQWARLRDWNGPVTEADADVEYGRLQSVIAQTLRR